MTSTGKRATKLATCTGNSPRARILVQTILGLSFSMDLATATLRFACSFCGLPVVVIIGRNERSVEHATPRCDDFTSRSVREYLAMVKRMGRA